MVSGQDLYTSLLDAIQEAKEAQADMITLGIERAHKEREYRVLKKQRIFFERQKYGTPATLVLDKVNGYEDVSSLRYDRDVAEIMEKANYERLLLAKKEIDVLNRMIAKEAGQL